MGIWVAKERVGAEIEAIGKADGPLMRRRDDVAVGMFVQGANVKGWTKGLIMDDCCCGSYLG